MSVPRHRLLMQSANKAGNDNKVSSKDTSSPIKSSDSEPLTKVALDSSAEVKISQSPVEESNKIESSGANNASNIDSSDVNEKLSHSLRNVSPQDHSPSSTEGGKTSLSATENAPYPFKATVPSSIVANAPAVPMKSSSRWNLRKGARVTAGSSSRNINGSNNFPRQSGGFIDSDNIDMSESHQNDRGMYLNHILNPRNTISSELFPESVNDVNVIPYGSSPADVGDTVSMGSKGKHSAVVSTVDNDGFDTFVGENTPFISLLTSSPSNLFQGETEGKNDQGTDDDSVSSMSEKDMILSKGDVHPRIRGASSVASSQSRGYQGSASVLGYQHVPSVSGSQFTPLYSRPPMSGVMNSRSSIAPNSVYSHTINSSHLNLSFAHRVRLDVKEVELFIHNADFSSESVIVNYDQMKLLHPGDHFFIRPTTGELQSVSQSDYDNLEGLAAQTASDNLYNRLISPETLNGALVLVAPSTSSTQIHSHTPGHGHSHSHSHSHNHSHNHSHSHSLSGGSIGGTASGPLRGRSAITISILETLARAASLSFRQPVEVVRLRGGRAEAIRLFGITDMELSFKDQFVGRSGQWRFRHSFLGHCVHVGEGLSALDYRMTVRALGIRRRVLLSEQSTSRKKKSKAQSSGNSSDSDNPVSEEMDLGDDDDDDVRRNTKGSENDRSEGAFSPHRTPSKITPTDLNESEPVDESIVGDEAEKTQLYENADQIMTGRMDRMISGIVTPSTHFTFRSRSSRIMILIQVSREAWDFESDGYTRFEHAVNNFLKTLTRRWIAGGLSHSISVVLFTRTHFSMGIPQLLVRLGIPLPPILRESTNPFLPASGNQEKDEDIEVPPQFHSFLKSVNGDGASDRAGGRRQFMLHEVFSASHMNSYGVKVDVSEKSNTKHDIDETSQPRSSSSAYKAIFSEPQHALCIRADGQLYEDLFFPVIEDFHLGTSVTSVPATVLPMSILGENPSVLLDSYFRELELEEQQGHQMEQQLGKKIGQLQQQQAEDVDLTMLSPPQTYKIFTVSGTGDSPSIVNIVGSIDKVASNISTTVKTPAVESVSLREISATDSVVSANPGDSTDSTNLLAVTPVPVLSTSALQSPPFPNLTLTSTANAASSTTTSVTLTNPQSNVLLQATGMASTGSFTSSMTVPAVTTAAATSSVRSLTEDCTRILAQLKAAFSLLPSIARWGTPPDAVAPSTSNGLTQGEDQDVTSENNALNASRTSDVSTQSLGTPVMSSRLSASFDGFVAKVSRDENVYSDENDLSPPTNSKLEVGRDSAVRNIVSHENEEDEALYLVENKYPQGTPSSACEGNFLEAINMCLNLFERSNVDRNLYEMGQNLVVVTGGSGDFEVSPSVAYLTKQRIIDNGYGCDVVSTARPPLHSVPLFVSHNRLPLLKPEVSISPSGRESSHIIEGKFDSVKEAKAGLSGFRLSSAGNSDIQKGAEEDVNRNTQEDDQEEEEVVISARLSDMSLVSFSQPHWLHMSFIGHVADLLSMGIHAAVTGGPSAAVGIGLNGIGRESDSISGSTGQGTQSTSLGGLYESYSGSADLGGTGAVSAFDGIGEFYLKLLQEEGFLPSDISSTTAPSASLRQESLSATSVSSPAPLATVQSSINTKTNASATPTSQNNNPNSRSTSQNVLSRGGSDGEATVSDSLLSPSPVASTTTTSGPALFSSISAASPSSSSSIATSNPAGPASSQNPGLGIAIPGARSTVRSVSAFPTYSTQSLVPDTLEINATSRAVAGTLNAHPRTIDNSIIPSNSLKHRELLALRGRRNQMTPFVPLPAASVLSFQQPKMTPFGPTYPSALFELLRLHGRVRVPRPVDILTLEKLNTQYVTNKMSGFKREEHSKDSDFSLDESFFQSISQPHSLDESWYDPSDPLANLARKQREQGYSTVYVPSEDTMNSSVDNMADDDILLIPGPGTHSKGLLASLSTMSGSRRRKLKNVMNNDSEGLGSPLSRFVPHNGVKRSASASVLPSRSSMPTNPSSPPHLASQGTSDLSGGRKESVSFQANLHVSKSSGELERGFKHDNLQKKTRSQSFSGPRLRSKIFSNSYIRTEDEGRLEGSALRLRTEKLDAVIAAAASTRSEILRSAVALGGHDGFSFVLIEMPLAGLSPDALPPDVVPPRALYPFDALHARLYRRVASISREESILRNKHSFFKRITVSPAPKEGNRLVTPHDEELNSKEDAARVLRLSTALKQRKQLTIRGLAPAPLPPVNNDKDSIRQAMDAFKRYDSAIFATRKPSKLIIGGLPAVPLPQLSQSTEGYTRVLGSTSSNTTSAPGSQKTSNILQKRNLRRVMEVELAVKSWKRLAWGPSLRLGQFSIAVPTKLGSDLKRRQKPLSIDPNDLINIGNSYRSSAAGSFFVSRDSGSIYPSSHPSSTRSASTHVTANERNSFIGPKNDDDGADLEVDLRKWDSCEVPLADLPAFLGISLLNTVMNSFAMILPALPQIPKADVRLSCPSALHPTVTLLPPSALEGAHPTSSLGVDPLADLGTEAALNRTYATIGRSSKWQDVLLRSSSDNSLAGVGKTSASLNTRDLNLSLSNLDQVSSMFSNSSVGAHIFTSTCGLAPLNAAVLGELLGSLGSISAVSSNQVQDSFLPTMHSHPLAHHTLNHPHALGLNVSDFVTGTVGRGSAMHPIGRTNSSLNLGHQSGFLGYSPSIGSMGLVESGSSLNLASMNTYTSNAVAGGSGFAPGQNAFSFSRPVSWVNKQALRADTFRPPSRTVPSSSPSSASNQNFSSKDVESLPIVSDTVASDVRTDDDTVSMPVTQSSARLGPDSVSSRIAKNLHISVPRLPSSRSIAEPISASKPATLPSSTAATGSRRGSARETDTISPAAAPLSAPVETSHISMLDVLGAASASHNPYFSPLHAEAKQIVALLSNSPLLQSEELQPAYFFLPIAGTTVDSRLSSRRKPLLGCVRRALDGSLVLVADPLAVAALSSFSFGALQGMAELASADFAVFRDTVAREFGLPHVRLEDLLGEMDLVESAAAMAAVPPQGTEINQSGVTHSNINDSFRNNPPPSSSPESGYNAGPLTSSDSLGVSDSGFSTTGKAQELMRKGIPTLGDFFPSFTSPYIHTTQNDDITATVDGDKENGVVDDKLNLELSQSEVDSSRLSTAPDAASTVNVDSNTRSSVHHTVSSNNKPILDNTGDISFTAVEEISVPSSLNSSGSLLHALSSNSSSNSMISGDIGTGKMFSSSDVLPASMNVSSTVDRSPSSPYLYAAGHIPPSVTVGSSSYSPVMAGMSHGTSRAMRRSQISRLNDSLQKRSQQQLVHSVSSTHLDASTTTSDRSPLKHALSISGPLSPMKSFSNTLSQLQLQSHGNAAQVGTTSLSQHSTPTGSITRSVASTASMSSPLIPMSPHVDLPAPLLSVEPLGSLPHSSSFTGGVIRHSPLVNNLSINPSTSSTRSSAAADQVPPPTVHSMLARNKIYLSRSAGNSVELGPTPGLLPEPSQLLLDIGQVSAASSQGGSANELHRSVSGPSEQFNNRYLQSNSHTDGHTHVHAHAHVPLHPQGHSVPHSNQLLSLQLHNNRMRSRTSVSPLFTASPSLHGLSLMSDSLTLSGAPTGQLLQQGVTTMKAGGAMPPSPIPSALMPPISMNESHPFGFGNDFAGAIHQQAYSYGSLALMSKHQKRLTSGADEIKTGSGRSLSANESSSSIAGLSPSFPSQKGSAAALKTGGSHPVSTILGAIQSSSSQSQNLKSIAANEKDGSSSGKTVNSDTQAVYMTPAALMHTASDVSLSDFSSSVTDLQKVRRSSHPTTNLTGIRSMSNNRIPTSLSGNSLNRQFTVVTEESRATAESQNSVELSTPTVRVTGAGHPHRNMSSSDGPGLDRSTNSMPEQLDLNKLKKSRTTRSRRNRRPNPTEPDSVFATLSLFQLFSSSFSPTGTSYTSPNTRTPPLPFANVFWSELVNPFQKSAAPLPSLGTSNRRRWLHLFPSVQAKSQQFTTPSIGLSKEESSSIARDPRLLGDSISKTNDGTRGRGSRGWPGNHPDFSYAYSPSSRVRSDFWTSASHASPKTSRTSQQHPPTTPKSPSSPLPGDPPRLTYAEVAARGLSPRASNPEGTTKSTDDPDTKVRTKPTLLQENPRHVWMNVSETLEGVLQTFLPSWKSLCEPAILPLTTDYLPTDADLQRKYAETTYSVVLPLKLPGDDAQTQLQSTPSTREVKAESESTFRSKLMQLHAAIVEEMVCQRLGQYFQLVVAPSVASVQSLGLSAQSKPDSQRMRVKASFPSQQDGSNFHAPTLFLDPKSSGFDAPAAAAATGNVAGGRRRPVLTDSSAGASLALLTLEPVDHFPSLGEFSNSAAAKHSTNLNLNMNLNLMNRNTLGAGSKGKIPNVNIHGANLVGAGTGTGTSMNTATTHTKVFILTMGHRIQKIEWNTLDSTVTVRLYFRALQPPRPFPPLSLMSALQHGITQPSLREDSAANPTSSNPSKKDQEPSVSTPVGTSGISSGVSSTNLSALRGSASQNRSININTISSISQYLSSAATTSNQGTSSGNPSKSAGVVGPLLDASAAVDPSSTANVVFDVVGGTIMFNCSTGNSFSLKSSMSAPDATLADRIPSQLRTSHSSQLPTPLQLGGELNSYSIDEALPLYQQMDSYIAFVAAFSSLMTDAQFRGYESVSQYSDVLVNPNIPTSRFGSADIRDFSGVTELTLGRPLNNFLERAQQLSSNRHSDRNTKTESQDVGSLRKNQLGLSLNHLPSISSVTSASSSAPAPCTSSSLASFPTDLALQRLSSSEDITATPTYTASPPKLIPVQDDSSSSSSSSSSGQDMVTSAYPITFDLGLPVPIVLSQDTFSPHNNSNVPSNLLLSPVEKDSSNNVSPNKTTSPPQGGSRVQKHNAYDITPYTMLASSDSENNSEQESSDRMSLTPVSDVATITSSTDLTLNSIDSVRTFSTFTSPLASLPENIPSNNNNSSSTFGDLPFVVNMDMSGSVGNMRNLSIPRPNSVTSSNVPSNSATISIPAILPTSSTINSERQLPQGPSATFSFIDLDLEGSSYPLRDSEAFPTDEAVPVSRSESNISHNRLRFVGGLKNVPDPMDTNRGASFSPSKETSYSPFGGLHGDDGSNGGTNSPVKKGTSTDLIVRNSAITSLQIRRILSMEWQLQRELAAAELFAILARILSPAFVDPSGSLLYSFVQWCPLREELIRSRKFIRISTTAAVVKQLGLASAPSAPLPSSVQLHPLNQASAGHGHPLGPMFVHHPLGHSYPSVGNLASIHNMGSTGVNSSSNVNTSAFLSSVSSSATLNSMSALNLHAMTSSPSLANVGFAGYGPNKPSSHVGRFIAGGSGNSEQHVLGPLGFSGSSLQLNASSGSGVPTSLGGKPASSDPQLATSSQVPHIPLPAFSILPGLHIAQPLPAEGSTASQQGLHSKGRSLPTPASTERTSAPVTWTPTPSTPGTSRGAMMPSKLMPAPPVIRTTEEEFNWSLLDNIITGEGLGTDQDLLPDSIRTKKVGYLLISSRNTLFPVNPTPFNLYSKRSPLVNIVTPQTPGAQSVANGIFTFEDHSIADLSAKSRYRQLSVSLYRSNTKAFASVSNEMAEIVHSFVDFWSSISVKINFAKPAKRVSSDREKENSRERDIGTTVVMKDGRFSSFGPSSAKNHVDIFDAFSDFIHSSTIPPNGTAERQVDMSNSRPSSPTNSISIRTGGSSAQGSIPSMSSGALLRRRFFQDTSNSPTPALGNTPSRPSNISGSGSGGNSGIMVGKDLTESPSISQPLQPRIHQTGPLSLGSHFNSAANIGSSITSTVGSVFLVSPSFPVNLSPSRRLLQEARAAHIMNLLGLPSGDHNSATNSSNSVELLNSTEDGRLVSHSSLHSFDVPFLDNAGTKYAKVILSGQSGHLRHPLSSHNVLKPHTNDRGVASSSSSLLSSQFLGGTFLPTQRTPLPSLEWALFLFSNAFSPMRAFSVGLQWITASSPSVEVFTSLLTRRARQGGFLLVPVPEYARRTPPSASVAFKFLKTKSSSKINPPVTSVNSSLKPVSSALFDGVTDHPSFPSPGSSLKSDSHSPEVTEYTLVCSEVPLHLHAFMTDNLPSSADKSTEKSSRSIRSAVNTSSTNDFSTLEVGNKLRGSYIPLLLAPPAPQTVSDVYSFSPGRGAVTSSVADNLPSFLFPISLCASLPVPIALPLPHAIDLLRSGVTLKGLGVDAPTLLLGIRAVLPADCNSSVLQKYSVSVSFPSWNQKLVQDKKRSCILHGASSPLQEGHDKQGEHTCTCIRPVVHDKSTVLVIDGDETIMNEELVKFLCFIYIFESAIVREFGFLADRSYDGGGISGIADARNLLNSKVCFNNGDMQDSDDLKPSLIVDPLLLPPSFAGRGWYRQYVHTSACGFVRIHSGGISFIPSRLLPQKSHSPLVSTLLPFAHLSRQSSSGMLPVPDVYDDALFHGKRGLFLALRDFTTSLINEHFAD